MWRLWRWERERGGQREFRMAWVDFRRSTVVFLYGRGVASKRKRYATLGSFDPGPWFVSKGRVATLIAGVANKTRTAEHNYDHPPSRCIVLCEIVKIRKILYSKFINNGTALPAMNKCSDAWFGACPTGPSHSSTCGGPPVFPDPISNILAASRETTPAMQLLMSVTWGHRSSKQSHGSAVIADRWVSLRATAKSIKGSYHG